MALEKRQLPEADRKVAQLVSLFDIFKLSSQFQLH